MLSNRFKVLISTSLKIVPQKVFTFEDVEYIRVSEHFLFITVEYSRQKISYIVDYTRQYKISQLNINFTLPFRQQF